MSAPYVAGLAACLMSALAQEGRRPDGAEVSAALRAAAAGLPGASVLDQGAGLPQLERAYRWLLAGHQGSGYAVRASTGGGSAAFRREGLAGPGDTVETFQARHVTGLRVAQFSLKSDAPWLSAPAILPAGSHETEIPLTYSAAALGAPGVYVGTVTAWNPSDALAGPVFRLVNVVVVPYDLADKPLYDERRTVGPAQVRRYFLRVAQPGATLVTSVTLADSGQQTARAILYAPNGAPFRDLARDSIVPIGGSQPGTARFTVRADDAVPGVYELDVVAPPRSGATATVRAQLAPLTLADREATNPGPAIVSGRVTQALLGVERALEVAGRGATPESLTGLVPDWAATAGAGGELPRARWRECTDCGVTGFDSAGQGFWGAWLEAPYRQVTGGPVDYLMMDYLAEVTMSILQKQKARDPSLGYATDFIPLLERILPIVAERRIKVTANAGGVNPRGCAQAVAETARRLRLGGKLRIGVVTGDDLLGRLDGLLARGHELRNLDTGRPLSDVRDRVLSANAYLGASPVVEALRGGADIVVTGRVTDTGLTLAPMMHAFGWQPDAWDLLAAGTVAGHTIECGAQSSGGNSLVDWQRVPDLANVGYPIVDAAPDGTFEICKHPGTGGRISVAGVTEQLVYEMGNPAEYITPDCVADFTTIRLEQTGKDRVRVSGVRGRPATDKLKVSIGYFYGYKAVGTLVYAWPDAYEKARAADRILRQRLADLGLAFEAVLTEFVGVDATHGPLARATAPLDRLPEVQLRIGVRSPDKSSVERFTREIAPLILNGPPSVTGFAGGRPKPEEIVAYWPALLDKQMVAPCVEVVDV